MDRELIYGEISTIGMKQFANLEPNCNKFMDVGSGYGKFTWVMASFLNATEAYGIEIDNAKFDIANKHFSGRYNPNCKFKRGDFRDYKNLIKEMDVVFSNCITWKLESVQELVECLSPTCNFYHNNKKYYFDNKTIHEITPLHMQWVNANQDYYKLITNFNR